MIIPPASLSSTALTAILEEFIGREGTDYGETELSLQQKIQLLQPQVLRGDVLIVFDEELETINLIAKKDLPRDQRHTE